MCQRLKRVSYSVSTQGPREPQEPIVGAQQDCFMSRIQIHTTCMKAAPVLKNKKKRYSLEKSLILMSEVRRRIIQTHENASPDGVLKSEEMRACVAEAASTIHSDELDTSR